MLHHITLLLGFLFLTVSHAAQPLPLPPDLWKDYDPNNGGLNERIVQQETREGIRKIAFLPAKDAELFKVIFAEFTWSAPRNESFN